MDINRAKQLSDLPQTALVALVLGKEDEIKQLRKQMEHSTERQTSGFAQEDAPMRKILPPPRDLVSRLRTTEYHSALLQEAADWIEFLGKHIEQPYSQRHNAVLEEMWSEMTTEQKTELQERARARAKQIAERDQGINK